MRGENREPEPRRPLRTGRRERAADQQQGQTVEHKQRGLRASAEQQRRRLDADQRVVFGVLMGVDRVIADHPGDRAGVKQEGRRIEPAELHGKAHQRAPRERQAEHDLRPVGDALHEGIGGDDAERGDAGENREAIELHEDDEPDQRLQHEENGGLFHADLPGRDRPRAGALDAGIEVAVGDVVPGAAGTAHHEGADEEQCDRPRQLMQILRNTGSQRRRPPAWHQQQPGADRAVEPRQPQIGPRPQRRTAIDPIAGRIRNPGGRVAHRPAIIGSARCRSACRRSFRRSSWRYWLRAMRPRSPARR